MAVMAFTVIGRAIGGMVHYRKQIPAKYRYGIAFAVYILISFGEGFYLFTPIPVMMLILFLDGFGGITSYTIRVSATQSYVPDEMKGRFNGAFFVLTTIGALAGEFAAGALSTVVGERMILCVTMMISAAAAVVLIGGGRKPIAAIYNRSE